MIDASATITRDELTPTAAAVEHYLKNSKRTRWAIGKAGKRDVLRQARTRGLRVKSRLVGVSLRRPEEVRLRIFHWGVLHYWHGSRITPKNADWLRVRPKARRGASRGEPSSESFFARVSPNLAMIAEPAGTKSGFTSFKSRRSGKRERRAFRVVFWLKKLVVFDRDTSVLPTDATLSGSALKAISQDLRRGDWPPKI